jgi:cob(I)alamin adenosyltransferase
MGKIGISYNYQEKVFHIIINMVKIYTRKGDEGLTSIKGKRIPKDSIIATILGEIDELQVSIGFLVASTAFQREFHKLIQKELFTISSIISEYLDTSNSLFESVIEINIDNLTKDLPKLTNFVFCGDNILECYANKARVDTRRLERSIVNLVRNTENPDNILKILPIINRLSDYFFTVGRCLNKNETRIIIKTGEIFTVDESS